VLLSCAVPQVHAIPWGWTHCIWHNPTAYRAAAQIKNYARVADSIVGWGSRLGTWSRLENHSVIGEDVFVRDEVLLNGAIVLPHKVRPYLFTTANLWFCTS
jgi:hypothetical protein